MKNEIKEKIISLWEAGKKVEAIREAVCVDWHWGYEEYVFYWNVDESDLPKEMQELIKVAKELSSDKKMYFFSTLSEILNPRPPVGYENWSDFGYDEDDEFFKAAISGLGDPLECHPSFLQKAVAALKANKARNGDIWKVYLSHGELSYDLIRRAISAHYRHTETSYDDLLDAGLDRDLAREAIR